MRLALALAALACAADAQTLRVRVVDADGKPAPHVLLAIRSGIGRPGMPAGAATTGTDGVATFEEAERWWTPAARGLCPRVEVDMPIDGKVSQSLLLPEVPREPLTLTLPPGAPTEVVLWRLRGEQVPPCALWLRWTDSASGRLRDERILDVPADADVVALPPLSARRELGIGIADAALKLWGGGSLGGDDDGPVRRAHVLLGARQDQRGREPVLLRRGPVLLRGRLTDERGEPLALVSAPTWGAPDARLLRWEGVEYETLALYPDGTFVALLPAPAEPQAFEDADSVSSRFTPPRLVQPDEHGGVLRSGQLELTRSDDWSVFRAADCALLPADLLVRGYVEGGDFAPIADAWIRVLEPKDAPEDLQDGRASARSDRSRANGMFAIRGGAGGPDEVRRLLVTAPGYVGSLVDLRALDAKRWVQVPLARPVALDGRVVVPAGMHAADLRISVRYDDRVPLWVGHAASDSRWSLAGIQPADDGSFHLAAVAPGKAWLCVADGAGELVLQQFVEIRTKTPPEPVVVDLRAAQH